MGYKENTLINIKQKLTQEELELLQKEQIDNVGKALIVGSKLLYDSKHFLIPAIFAVGAYASYKYLNIKQ